MRDNLETRWLYFFDNLKENHIKTSLGLLGVGLITNKVNLNELKELIGLNELFAHGYYYFVNKNGISAFFIQVITNRKTQ